MKKRHCVAWSLALVIMAVYSTGQAAQVFESAEQLPEDNRAKIIAPKRLSLGFRKNPGLPATKWLSQVDGVTIDDPIYDDVHLAPGPHVLTVNTMEMVKKTKTEPYRGGGGAYYYTPSGEQVIDVEYEEEVEVSRQGRLSLRAGSYTPFFIYKALDEKRISDISELSANLSEDQLAWLPRKTVSSKENGNHVVFSLLEIAGKPVDKGNGIVRVAPGVYPVLIERREVGKIDIVASRKLQKAVWGIDKKSRLKAKLTVGTGLYKDAQLRQALSEQSGLPTP